MRLSALMLSVFASWFAFGGGLEWRLPKGAVREGDILSVRLENNGTSMATAPLELSAYVGKVLKVTVKCRGENVAPGPQHWLGFKFMISYTDAVTGAKSWPGAKCESGSWDWKTVEILMDLRRVKPEKAGLSLGIQDSRGFVQFDLSTLKFETVKPLFEYDTSTEKCVYTDRVKTRQIRRGVMLPANACKEDDFMTLRDWGATLARYQMVRRWNAKNDNTNVAEYVSWVDSKIDHLLNEVLPWAEKYGIEVVVDLHVPPGGRREDGDMNMFYDEKYANVFIDVWKRIATRCRDRKGIWGYDLINEPCQKHQGAENCDYWTLQKRVAEAVRKIDPVTPIVIESSGWDSPTEFPIMHVLDMPDVIYQAHMYMPHEFTHQGVHGKWKPIAYPNAEKGWDREYLRRCLQPVLDFQRRHDAKIYIGEFSAIAWAEGPAEYLKDCISIFEEYGWDWTYHAFREWNGWSVEHDAQTPGKFASSADNPRKRALLKGFRNAKK